MIVVVMPAGPLERSYSPVLAFDTRAMFARYAVP